MNGGIAICGAPIFLGEAEVELRFLGETLYPNANAVFLTLTRYSFLLLCLREIDVGVQGNINKN